MDTHLLISDGMKFFQKIMEISVKVWEHRKDLWVLQPRKWFLETLDNLPGLLPALVIERRWNAPTW